mgnify:CR=1 FL=1
MSQPSKKPEKPKNIRTWIRERTSPYCYGVKSKAGKPAHCNKNDDIKYHFSCLESGWYGRRLSSLRNADMDDHFSAKETFYFTADGCSATTEVLVNIDIDCHGSGSLAGAVAFAEHLRATRFPNLYYEASTNGNGVHGYLVVEKGDLGDDGLNGALIVLDRWLKAELSKGDWDVENVEVMGQAPEFTWGRQKFELKSYKSGQLAKLPREALSRAEELRGTTRLTVQELRKLPVPAAHESGASVVHPAGRATKKTPAVSVSESENRKETSPLSPRVEKKGGSIAGRHFDDAELAKLGTGYSSLAKDLLGQTKLIATGRMVVTEEDLAIFLMILRFFSSNMNADGSLPVARWKEMWAALHGTGDIRRAWCHHRFASIRNFLTGEGWLSWADEEFVVGVYAHDGRYVPGMAAKWKAGEELMAMMETVDVQEVVVGGDPVSEVGGVEAVGAGQDKEREEGRSILYGNNQDDPHLDLPVTEQDDPSIAPTTARSATSTPDLGQSTLFQDLLDSFGIWTPLPKPRFAGYSTGNYRMAA